MGKDIKMKITFPYIKKLALEESKNYQLTRNAQRQKDLGEVFTPTSLVLDILKKLPKGKNGWGDDTKTYLDPACGNGQFLAPILIIKLQLGHNPEQALSTIYGVDIMSDNVVECRKRLWLIATNGSNDINFKRRCQRRVKKNIVCADALKYDFSFGEKQ